MPHSLLRFTIVLGLISAIGPFAIDMYLPALPTIGASLQAGMGAVQASLMAFFLALCLGQVVYGPVSDMAGRKAPLVFGLSLFTLGSIGCALAPDIHTLVVLRFVQGLGACATMVIPRAVVRDMHTGTEAARLMALLMLVLSVSPILAPLAGSLLIEFSGWRSVFWTVTAIGAACLAMTVRALPETRPVASRRASSVGSALAGYAALLGDRHFLGLVGIGAFGVATFFAYLANSPFVLIGHHGLSPRQYGIAFAVNAASFIGASQVTARLGARFGLVRVVRMASHGFAAAMLLLFALLLAGVDRLDVLIVLLLVGYGFLGLVLPISAVLALDRHGALAGTASALMGTVQFAVGAGVMALIGVFVDGSPRPMVTGIALCSVVTWLLVRGTLAHPSGSDTPQEGGHGH